MTTPVGSVLAATPVVAVAHSKEAASKGHGHAKKNDGLVEAGREFEAIFVRSMLKETPLAKKGDAYGDMAVDAVAKAITAGPGLGLGELIRRAVETNEKSANGEQKTPPPLKPGK
jgi:Rod binding domain-containing protein